MTRIKKPSQQRSQQRMDLVLQTTEKLLSEKSPDSISIPEISLACNIPRASIYQFFPNIYAIYFAVANAHLQKIVTLLKQQFDAELQKGRELSTKELTRLMLIEGIHNTAQYYNAHPAASILILGGPFMKATYIAHQEVLEEIGRTLRIGFEAFKSPVLSATYPNTFTILVEIIFACMKYGYYNENHISERACEEALKAAKGYLYQVARAASSLPHPN